MRTRSIGLSILCSFALFALAGCSKTDEPRTGTVRVQMTDAPSTIDAVNLVVTQVAVRRDGAGPDSSSGWEVIQSTSATYDLLALQNGTFANIASGRVPVGHYTQLRLVLGAGSNVIVDGVTYPLTVPSGMQSGVKVIGAFDVTDGGITDVALDFDASRSIVLTGSGTYILKPTIKILPMSTAGAISGTVSATGVTTSIYAIQSPDTLGTTVAKADGSFKVSVLAPGTYSLAFDPLTTYRDTTLVGVTVTAGQTTNVGTVQLTALPIP